MKHFIMLLLCLSFVTAHSFNLPTFADAKTPNISYEQSFSKEKIVNLSMEKFQLNNDLANSAYSDSFKKLDEISLRQQEVLSSFYKSKANQLDDLIIKVLNRSGYAEFTKTPYHLENFAKSERCHIIKKEDILPNRFTLIVDGKNLCSWEYPELHLIAIKDKLKAPYLNFYPEV